MIYDNLKKTERVNDVPQIIEEVERYEKYFKVEDGDVVVDIGAHIGMFAKKHIGIASKIYAIEPDPMFFKSLDVEGIIPLQMGISNVNDTLFIKSDGNANAVNNSEGVPITVQTFESFLSNNDIKKIDFLKIDCEGAEYDILTDKNINWLSQNCKKITGEFHIHNDEHRLKLPLVLHYFEKYNIPYRLSSVDGFDITKDNLLNKLNYYKEVLFYASKQIKHKNSVSINYVNGCFIELKDWPDDVYNIQFINRTTKEVLYSTNIGNNSWAKCNYEYFVDWQVVISQQGEIVKVINLNLNDLKVYVHIDSKSLGDTLAWFPYIDEFRKKHNCKIICSTFLNSLFKDTYQEIEFIEPGKIAENISAQYNIGWYYNGDNINLYKNVTDPKIQPMQKTASDILGMEYKEIKPKLKLPNVEKTDVVTLAIHSTSQAKYWNNPTGWQDTVDFIKSKNYVPLLVSREADGYMGNKHPTGLMYLDNYNLDNIIKEICKSKLFVGIGTGLTWLAWACDIPVVLISGFSYPYTEMNDCHRITTPEGYCTGCFNRYKLDAGDWKWCPEHRGTERQFECSKTIQSETVINQIKQILNAN